MPNGPGRSPCTPAGPGAPPRRPEGDGRDAPARHIWLAPNGRRRTAGEKGDARAFTAASMADHYQSASEHGIIGRRIETIVAGGGGPPRGGGAGVAGTGRGGAQGR